MNGSLDIRIPLCFRTLIKVLIQLLIITCIYVQLKSAIDRWFEQLISTLFPLLPMTTLNFKKNVRKISPTCIIISVIEFIGVHMGFKSTEQGLLYTSDITQMACERQHENMGKRSVL